MSQAVHPPDPHATEQARALLAALRPRLQGEARFDLVTRALYATDASLYQVMPVGVVLPRSEEDVFAALACARAHGVPIVARGSGSSLDGQAVGAGLVLDFSRHLNGLIEVDAEARTARVQPGLVLDRLNEALAPQGLMVGPDPASSNRATLGGMIGNNATGAHSILYGMTHDHVRSLRVLLADGSATIVGPLSPAAAAAKRRLPGHEGAIYRLTQRLLATHRDEIAARFPQHWRSVSGYGLDRLAAGDPTNLAPLLCGSEGTLALTLEATIGLVPRPAHRALAVVHFRSLDEAMEAVPTLLATRPAAIELLDEYLLELTRAVPEFARRLTFIEGEPRCVLVVEVFGEGAAEVEAGLARVAATGVGYATVLARTAAERAHVWEVRKAGVGLLMSTTSEWKPLAFIEDGSVPPERLAEFVREVRAILDAHGTSAAFYAHASAGCLHIRPLLNVKLAEDVERMRSIAEAWGDVIVRLRGSFSGEHGDGRARSEWNEKLFGPTLYGAFCELKDGWDPEGLLNPGIIVRGQRMTASLRLGPAYEPIAPPPMLRFEQAGGFARAVELCSGIGACRKTGAGTMCPSFMATREEEHSTRGRANALRTAMSGAIPREMLLSPRMAAVLDLCLACKACAAECPSQVDMARIKSEFLYHYQREHGLPLRDRLFGHSRLMHQVGSRTAPLSNWLAGTGAARWMQGRLGIAPERRLPRFARRSFLSWFREHRRGRPAGDRRVVLFPDTFTLYAYPSIGVAAVRVLEAAGYEVIVPEGIGCCARPMLSKGMLDDARRTLEQTVATLLPYAQAGLAVVGLEPSCLLTFREEAPDLLAGEGAQQVAAQSYLLDEWLMQRQGEGALAGLRWGEAEQALLLHGHCHHRASGIQSAVAALNLPPGYRTTLIEAGCCGMAGAFGFEREHYGISLAIGEDRLFPAIRRAPGAGVAVTGVSCRQQIEHATGRPARHLAEWLAEALDSTEEKQADERFFLAGAGRVERGDGPAHGTGGDRVRGVRGRRGGDRGGAGPLGGGGGAGRGGAGGARARDGGERAQRGLCAERDCGQLRGGGGHLRAGGGARVVGAECRESAADAGPRGAAGHPLAALRQPAAGGKRGGGAGAGGQCAAAGGGWLSGRAPAGGAARARLFGGLVAGRRWGDAAGPAEPRPAGGQRLPCDFWRGGGGLGGARWVGVGSQRAGGGPRALGDLGDECVVGAGASLFRRQGGADARADLRDGAGAAPLRDGGLQPFRLLVFSADSGAGSAGVRALAGGRGAAPAF